VIVVLGKNGQLAKEFQKIYKGKAIYLSSQDIDLTRLEKIIPALNKLSPDLLVNFTAYNNVDLAEKDSNNFLINSLAIKEIASYSNLKDIPLIHISTDYVFDGTKGSYAENDTPNPINKYGKAKLDGENYIQNICKKYFIIRTSWLYSCFGENFLTKVIAMYKSKADLMGAYDLIGSPTSAKSLAHAIKHLIELNKENNRDFGIFHFSNQGSISKYTFVKKIVSSLNLDLNSEEILIKKVKNSDFNLAAQRPYNTTLVSNKFSEKFNYKIPCWEDELKSIIGEI
tara:strand:- start:16327 stop:17178 length:852 start_codon:yes stop_codon:yes gene_type:complete